MWEYKVYIVEKKMVLKGTYPVLGICPLQKGQECVRMKHVNPSHNKTNVPETRREIYQEKV